VEEELKNDNIEPEQPIEDDAEKPSGEMTTGKNKSSKWLAIIIIVLAVVIVGLSIYVVKILRQDTIELASDVTIKTVMEGTGTQAGDGTTWITPEKLEDLKLFSAIVGEAGVDYTGTDYYKVGTTKDGEDIIIAKVKITGMMDYTELHRFVRGGGVITRIVKNSNPIDSDAYAIAGFKDDTDRSFPDLSVDSNITEGSTKLVLLDSGWFPTSSDELPVGKRVKQTQWGDLMLTTTDLPSSAEATGLVKAGQYYIILKDSTLKYFEPKPNFINDDNSINVTWSDTDAQSAYNAMPALYLLPTSGCGLGVGTFPVVASDALLTDKTVIAQNTAGSKLYKIGNSGKSLLEYGYSVYESAPGANGAGTYDSFVKESGMVVWIDDFGTPLTYVLYKWLPEAECGKPVVYLYPTEETDFTVKVGAKITKSLPEYINNWTGVAYPDGRLVVNGQNYPNLFWEGLGYGFYPTIDSGTVVENRLVESTLRSQMTEMGLNATEANDFMEYWLPKMPKTKYVRLTWLGTEEMNRLAPLMVKPNPDSVIRVFLDFEGSDTMINIKAQTLPHNSREGFTLVEWGGLLK